MKTKTLVLGLIVKEIEDYTKDEDVLELVAKAKHLLSELAKPDEEPKNESLVSLGKNDVSRDEPEKAADDDDDDDDSIRTEDAEEEEFEESGSESEKEDEDEKEGSEKKPDKIKEED